VSNLHVGIMQGRLSPPVGNRFQAFPVEQWREEFPKAAAAGLACIEWIYEKPDEERNPLRDEAGIAAIRDCANRHGVAVRSICADYYMTEHLVDTTGAPIAAHVSHLHWLIGQAARLGVTYIVIPFVDSSSLRQPEQVAGAPAVLREAGVIARGNGVELHVECDLPPNAFRGLLEDIGEPSVKANYDIGNSASLGYHPRDELPLIAPHLGSVHIKDRRRDGGTVPLGTGDADLVEAFRQIRAANFERWLVMQVARDEAVDHVEWARTNRMTVERLWKAAH
jgi:L-ribulose-5-phosphate 3-epimerase